MSAWATVEYNVPETEKGALREPDEEEKVEENADTLGEVPANVEGVSCVEKVDKFRHCGGHRGRGLRVVLQVWLTDLC